MTYRHLLRTALFLALSVTSIFAQTNAWPFPPRPGTESAKAGFDSSALTVAFWNIQWFPGRSPDSSPAEQTQQINSVHGDIAQLNADIIGMEEVADFTKAGLAVNQLRGFKVDVCANFPPREGQNRAQEVAIASRFPAMSAWSELWKSAGAATPPRGFAFAAYEVAPRQLLLVYGVHLKSNLGELTENVAMRRESVRQLQSHMKAMEEVYAKVGNVALVVGGDFNTSLDDPLMATDPSLRELMNGGLLWAWQNVPLGTRMTMPANKNFAATCFDHIFYRGLTLRRAWVGNCSPNSSDHRPVVATFNLAR